MSQRRYNVAVVGATGNAGMTTLQILAERKFPMENIVVVASKNSVGKVVSCGDRILKINDISEIDFSKFDLAIFCAGSAVSAKYAENVTKSGCCIIDKTSHFRFDPHVPLIVPEVNGDMLQKGAQGIISTPNCVATPLSVSLKALSNINTIRRIVVSTYQSVSGAGKKAIEELYSQTKNVISALKNSNEVFPKQIAFKVIPLIGDLNSGVSGEEEKISREICKILKLPIRVAVTCVRVPVFIGHAMSVACEFENPMKLHDVYDAFNNMEGLVVVDRRDRNNGFSTPMDVQGEDGIHISRVRKDTTVENGVLYWIACDNLRKGAALNSVQIAETMIKIDPTLGIFKSKVK